MITLKKYQTDAIEELMEKAVKMLNNTGFNQKLIFKAPTGSGKTVMMSALLNRLSEELPSNPGIFNPNVAFVWIAPNKLHLQSYNSIKSFFSEIRTVRPIQFDDITDGRLHPGEVLFLNWESINKENNVYVRENESGKDVYSFINGARIEGNTEIIVIIDEEHMFAGATAAKAQDFLKRIYPKIEIRVSATPTSVAHQLVTVDRDAVIAEEMIKEGIILNPALDGVAQDGKTLNEILIDKALEKREEIAESYRKLGVNINPLLLIQLPNDNKIALTATDTQIIEQVTQYLDVMKGITEENERLAVWLSDKKSPHLDEIIPPDSVTEVLLFKQAIALGWDCPRAAVLLIFRDLQSTTFTIQTVGRILRMPEQKYYPNTLLNQGYVYTNLSRNQIEVVRDDMNYISTSPARRIDSYREGDLHLLSTYYNTRRPDRNRLGSRYRTELYKTAEDKWGVSNNLFSGNYVITNHELLKSQMIDTHISELDLNIPENVILTGGEDRIDVSQNVVFSRTPAEIEKMFLKFCRDHIGGYAPFDSVPVLAGALIGMFEEYLDIFETQAQMIILHPNNRVQFIELIEESYKAYESVMEKVAQNVVRNPHVFSWEVPAERIYNLNNYTLKKMPTHVLLPFHEQTSASGPEKLFALFLEQNKYCIEWWYKNGDSGKEHLAIPYVNSKGIASLFYVDFIILMKDGTRCLFDTKTKGSDPEAHLKHNALCIYMESLRKNNINVKGGILINDHNDPDCWRFSEFPIENTENLKGWSYFKPIEFTQTVTVE